MTLSELGTKELSVIEKVRRLTPRRPLTLNEAYRLSELQATKLREYTDNDTEPRARFDAILKLDNITVKTVPNYRLMDHIAGMSRFKDGHWLILVDENTVHGRRRFTLAHELKHVIDHQLAPLIYSGFAYGDEERRKTHIENICQHFAACYLVPKTLLKRAWGSGIQNIDALSGLFQVSLTAMEVRLKQVGLIEQGPKRDITTYFRRELLLLPGEATSVICGV
ncbi:MAG: ImmA/IrrE family metallo-endopeptidase [Streptosporangiaceae bacterium]|nr:ImmA/IrrE family metallo-endopeptidase [Streptosporangiaceae bacterium]